MSKQRKVTFVIAPNLTVRDLKALEARWNRQEQPLVFNHQLWMVKSAITPQTVIIAPGIPPAEVNFLREQIKKQDVVFVNYEIFISNCREVHQ